MHVGGGAAGPRHPLARRPRRLASATWPTRSARTSRPSSSPAPTEAWSGYEPTPDEKAPAPDRLHPGLAHHGLRRLPQPADPPVPLRRRRGRRRARPTARIDRSLPFVRREALKAITATVRRPRRRRGRHPGGALRLLREGAAGRSGPPRRRRCWRPRPSSPSSGATTSGRRWASPGAPTRPAIWPPADHRLLALPRRQARHQGRRGPSRRTATTATRVLAEDEESPGHPEAARAVGAVGG